MERVTLEDFRELQKELLKAREALYNTETKVKGYRNKPLSEIEQTLLTHVLSEYLGRERSEHS